MRLPTEPELVRAREIVKRGANVNLRLSTSPVGPCVPVPDGSIVDAEKGIAGG
mgnify:CR=1 FL=1